MYKEFETCTAVPCMRAKNLLSMRLIQLFLEFLSKINTSWGMELQKPCANSALNDRFGKKANLFLN